MNCTASFIFIDVIFFLGYLFPKTRKISSTKDCPTVGTLSKSSTIDSNFSRPTRILLACDLEIAQHGASVSAGRRSGGDHEGNHGATRVSKALSSFIPSLK